MILATAFFGSQEMIVQVNDSLPRAHFSQKFLSAFNSALTITINN